MHEINEDATSKPHPPENDDRWAAGEKKEIIMHV